MIENHSRRLVFLVFCLIANSQGPFLAWADQNTDSHIGDTESKYWRLSLSADYLGVGNANSSLTPTPDICSAMLAKTANTSCITSTKAYGAESIRVTIVHDYKGIELGPSVSYMNGGPGIGRTNIHTSGAVGGTSNANISVSADVLRFLGEARKTWSISGPWAAHMGAGLGVAVENKATSCYSGGNNNIASVCADFGLPDYSSFGWLTWELSPAVVYRSMSLGLRYVGFGRGAQVPWNTLGAFFGVDF